MRFSLSTGVKKTLGMAILYALIPLFVLWYAVFVLKAISFDLLDVGLLAIAFLLIMHLYRKYIARVKREAAKQYEEIVEETEEELEAPEGNEADVEEGEETAEAAVDEQEPESGAKDAGEASKEDEAEDEAEGESEEEPAEKPAPRKMGKKPKK